MTQQSFWRAYPAQLEQTGPRTLSGRLVPYDMSADVVDFVDGNPEVYREGFRRGAFAPQANNPSKGVISKIGLVHRHGPNGLGYLGPFVALREEDDGLYGDARVLPSVEADVSMLLDNGVDELSVEFRLPRGEHTVEAGGVRWRTRAHLDQVALEPKGAYSSAQVLAFRGEVEDEQREAAEAAAKAEQERQERERSEAEERARAEAVEAEAAAAAARRAEWEALTSRFDTELEKQNELVREYGVTQPGGMGSRLGR